MAIRSRPLLAWLDARTGWLAWTGALAERRVAGWGVEPALAAAGLFLLTVLAASGVLLLMHYRPSEGEAQASIVTLGSAVPFGALVRGVHQWASDALLVVACAWILALVMRRAYRSPGELVWISAALLWLVVLCLAFTGGVLPFGERATAHARVATSLWSGTPSAFSALLARAFGLHVAVLPAALTPLLAAHYVLRRRASEALAEDGARLPLYPDFFVRVAALWAALLLALVCLSMFAPGLALEASGIGPPWYLGSIHALLRAAPDRALGATGPRLVVAVVITGYLTLLALPFLDPRGSRAARVIAWAGALALAALTVHGNL